MLQARQEVGRAEVLARHAQVVETEACLLDALPGAPRGGGKNPLAPADLYYNK